MIGMQCTLHVTLSNSPAHIFARVESDGVTLYMPCDAPIGGAGSRRETTYVVPLRRAPWSSLKTPVL